MVDVARRASECNGFQLAWRCCREFTRWRVVLEFTRWRVVLEFTRWRVVLEFTRWRVVLEFTRWRVVLEFTRFEQTEQTTFSHQRTHSRFFGFVTDAPKWHSRCALRWACHVSSRPDPFVTHYDNSGAI